MSLSTVEMPLSLGKYQTYPNKIRKLSPCELFLLRFLAVISCGLALLSPSFRALLSRKKQVICFEKRELSFLEKINVPAGKITSGHGEYLIMAKNQPLDKARFEKAYAALNQKKFKEIDPDLDIVFIPRTLYELVFIHKCIKEDLKNHIVCHLTDPKEHEKQAAIKKCWHACYFEDAGDNLHPQLIDIAFRLNQTMLKRFKPTHEGFTHSEILQFANQEIEFLKAHHENKDVTFWNTKTPGPTMNFRHEYAQNEIKPMGIRDEKDAEIIRKAIALECSEIAQKSFLLYRGANLKKDAPASEEGVPFSLSYGTSLFAGCIFDGGATAYFHIRKDFNQGFVIPIPREKLHEAPFFVPQTNALAQAFGYGEIFHGRNKVWSLKNMHGIQHYKFENRVDHLKSDLSKEELVTEFQKYKDQAISLKGG